MNENQIFQMQEYNKMKGSPSHFHKDGSEHFLATNALFSWNHLVGRNRPVAEGSVVRYTNGTIDWGTKNNRPRKKPLFYYQSFKEIVKGAGF